MNIDEIIGSFTQASAMLDDHQPNVSIFGSARIAQNTPAAKQAYQMARQLSDAGINVITGGGPGIMEAANRGAFEGKSTSIGLNIELPDEQVENPYLDECIWFEHFFIRKVMLIYYSSACVFFDGGFGTADELFEVLTLIQTHKIKPVPLYLIGTEFWQPLMGWLQILQARNLIGANDLELIQVTDDIEGVFRTLCLDVKQS